LVKTQWQGAVERDSAVEYAESLHPVVRLPALLNGFSLWNRVILVLMLASFGYPIAQFFLLHTYSPSAWGY
jgi:cytochrome c oxidase subunit 1